MELQSLTGNNTMLIDPFKVKNYLGLYIHLHYLHILLCVRPNIGRNMVLALPPVRSSVCRVTGS